jgi:hypothetical protein
MTTKHTCRHLLGHIDTPFVVLSSSYYGISIRHVKFRYTACMQICSRPSIDNHRKSRCFVDYLQKEKFIEPQKEKKNAFHFMRLSSFWRIKIFLWNHLYICMPVTPLTSTLVFLNQSIQSHFTTDGQSVIMSRYRAHSWTCDQILLSVWRLFSEISCLVFVGCPLWREVRSVICLSQSSNSPLFTSNICVTCVLQFNNLYTININLQSLLFVYSNYY